jgi:hypothetical protein
VNQNLVVIAGSTSALKTSARGLRTSIPAFTGGTCVSLSSWTAMVMHLSAEVPHRCVGPPSLRTPRVVLDMQPFGCL